MHDPLCPFPLTRHLGFCLGTAVHHILRGDADDLRKAIQCLEWEIKAPQPPISAIAYRDAEAALDSIVNALRGKETILSEAQADFLIALDGYIQLPSPDGGKVLLSRVIGMAGRIIGG